MSVFSRNLSLLLTSDMVQLLCGVSHAMVIDGCQIASLFSLRVNDEMSLLLGNSDFKEDQDL